jgi:raffinose/stachyose/melibiose transport system substrate-binding protein
MRYARFAVGLLGGAALALGVLATDSAQASRSDTITITMIANNNKQPAYDILIPNFERAYPNIKVNVTYGAPPTVFQLERVELAGGNAPDLLYTLPGCGSVAPVCVLAKSGDLAPMIKTPWVKRSLPLVTSADKHGPALYAFTPAVAPYGIFTNDDLFKKLGLSIPRTFPQLLDRCRKARAAGTVAVLFAAGGVSSLPGLGFLSQAMAVATLYGKDKHWAAKLRAANASFEGTPGWREALQHVVDLNDAGCFQPGVTGTIGATQEFALGQGLMLPGITTSKGVLDAANPQFSYSFHPFPGGTDPNQTTTLLQMSDSVGVNAHATVEAQRAAQTFVSFIARPKQNALYAQTTGGLTQYQFLHGQFPAFMSDVAAALNAHKYVIAPFETWWNASVVLALQQGTLGLLTGQQSIDDVLNAMDAAWKQGPQ